MLCSLLVENYALISRLEIEFTKGLTIITGETGAGKSILLGALSLILGKRADAAVLFDRNRKCIVEGSFDLCHDHLTAFFSENSIDYEQVTILRREVSPSGKSRAFINDIPVTLEKMSELASSLIDIHSQYQTLNLGSNLFQMKVVDSYAHNQGILKQYQQQFQEYQQQEISFRKLGDEIRRLKDEQDYLVFQHSQLESARLSENEQEELEAELEQLTHAEEIKNGLTAAEQELQEDSQAVLLRLKECQTGLSRILQYLPEGTELLGRLESAYIELKDFTREIIALNDKVQLDPERLNLVRERLDLIYTLEKKPRAACVGDLIRLQQELSRKIRVIDSSDDELKEAENRLQEKKEQLRQLSTELSARRLQCVPSFEKHVTGMLRDLNMPHASFRVTVDNAGGMTPWGGDSVHFLFSASKNAPLLEISKVASGGELSRLMLSIKSQLSDTTDLPTLIFDEIDTGISGEVAERVGNIIARMADRMQIINITHLPQIASKGETHFLVYKNEEGESAVTRIKALSHAERHQEIARMLSGEEITSEALENARALLKN